MLKPRRNLSLVALPRASPLSETARTRNQAAFAVLQRALGKSLQLALTSDAQAWDASGVGAIALRDALQQDELDSAENGVRERYRGADRSALLDRLLERRIERALACALEAEAADRGVRLDADFPSVTLVGLGASIRWQSATIEDTVARRPTDIAPGRPLDQLVQDALEARANQEDRELELRIAWGDGRTDVLGRENAQSFKIALGGIRDRLEKALQAHEAQAQEERDLTGMVLGRYRIKRLKGKGGFGSVYEAKDEILGARVAIKVLNRRAERSPKALEQFLREAKLVTKIDHENIVRWITFDRTADGLHYFVMEYVGGEELEEILQREGKIDAERVTSILLQVLRALRAAHGDAALLHLDLKPENVFVLPPTGGSEQERVKVIDFGIGQHVGAEARVENVATASASELSSLAELDPARSISITLVKDMADADEKRGVTRARGGTLLYASPEQCQHMIGDRDIQRLDGRSDLYSLGVMAFRMLTGEFPFERCDSAFGVVNNHLRQPPRKVGSLGVRVPRRLATFVDRCLLKDREKRWADAGVAYEFLAPPKRQSTRRQAVLLGGTLLLAAAAVYGAYTRDGSADSFDLQRVGRGPLAATEALSGGTLYVGELESGESQSVELYLSGVSLAAAPSELLLVDRDGAELQDWALSWAGEGSAEQSILLRRRAEAVSSGRWRDVCVRISAQGAERVSRPFELRYIARDALEIETVEVSGANGKAIDPVGAELVVSIGGDFEVLREVSVIADTSRVPALARSDPDQRAGSLDFAIELDRLKLTSGRNTIVLQVTDRAGQSRDFPYDMDVALGPLEMKAGLTSVSPVQGTYVFGPRRKPELEVVLNRPAELAWSFNRGVEIVSGAQSVEAGGTTIAIPFAGDSSYEGNLVVEVDDRALVRHIDPKRGKDCKSIPFVYNVEDPEVRITVRGSGPPKNAADGKTLFINESAFDLEVTPETPIRTWVEAMLAGEGTEQVVVDSEVPTAGRSESVSVPHDGVYSMRVRGYRVEAVSRRRLPQFESEASFELVVDTEPSVVRIAASEEHLVLKSLDGRTVVRISVDDLVYHDVRNTPVELELELKRQLLNKQWQSIPGSRRVLEDRHLAPPCELVLEDVLRELSPEALPDGDYRLCVGGNDLAGNHLEEAVFNWSVARNPPTVAVLLPSEDSVWKGRDRRFEMRLRAVDPNGVGAVRCELKMAGSTKMQVEQFTRTSTSEVDSVWEGAFSLNAAWSEAPATLRVVASDKLGQKAVGWEGVVRLDYIERDIPRRISLVREGGSTTTPMRFVKGNSSVEYIFGGRGVELENRTYRRYGLGAFKNRSEPVSQVPGAIEDYYLDEHEVTVSQYLDFLGDGQGYGQVRWWPEGLFPKEAHRLWLTAQLRELDPSLPVVGVDWAEASAYAAWAGKELPTLLQWEYVVRGGEAYRPFSSAKAGVGPPLEASFNYNNQSESASVWPVRTSQDVTAETHIYDLCSNAAEWTRTSAEYWREPRYFVAGASFRMPRYDFYQAERTRQSKRSDEVGFRCAVPAEVVLGIYDSGAAQELRVEPIRSPLHHTKSEDQGK